jgi:hypothetical protein
MPASLLTAWEAAHELTTVWHWTQATLSVSEEYENAADQFFVDYVSMGEWLDKLEKSLDLVGDEFIAVAASVYHSRFDSDASAFHHLLSAARSWWMQFGNSAWGLKFRDALPEIRSKSQTWFTQACRTYESMPEFSIRRLDRFRALALQELCRASDRRCITKRSRPGDEISVSLSSIRAQELAASHAKAEKLRPAYERDHCWLDWHEQDHLGPAPIRDRWDQMTDEERKAICPRSYEKVGGRDAESQNAGRETVKKGLKKAKKERGS